MQRNLSGMYFRFKPPEATKFENWCFEDLPVPEQERILKEASPVFAQGIALRLAETLKEIGDKFEIGVE
jgi:hypothetical protein